MGSCITTVAGGHGLSPGRKIKVVAATDSRLVSSDSPGRWTVVISLVNVNTFRTAANGAIPDLSTGSLTYIGNVDVDQLDSDPSIPA
jgi:hypothetical protein